MIKQNQKKNESYRSCLFIKRRLSNLDNISRLSKINISSRPINDLKLLGNSYFLTNLKVSKN